ncbi:hypothetical protein [Flavisolibacter nicotianae]|uniref:hypothetical protein n=1 Tax=Flavisolibacter nicotianae TaxID=2364882 RepID=UPI000EAD5CB8|nr:hypothetical protein [Flavisolibacter nicotianae]
MDVFPLLAQLNTNLTVGERESVKKQLAVYLNELVLHDFAALVQLLYRVDVPEKNVKAVLQENPTEDAGSLLADLLIRRQLEKRATKERFRSSDETSEEERW